MSTKPYTENYKMEMKYKISMNKNVQCLYIRIISVVKISVVPQISVIMLSITEQSLKSGFGTEEQ